MVSVSSLVTVTCGLRQMGPRSKIPEPTPIPKLHAPIGGPPLNAEGEGMFPIFLYLQGQTHLVIPTTASNDHPAIKIPKNRAYVMIQKNPAQTFRSLPTQSRESTYTGLFITSFW